MKLSGIIGFGKRVVRQLIEVPFYWVPYNFFGGKALPPQNVDIELTFNCNLKCRICPQHLFKSKSKTEKPAAESARHSGGELTSAEILNLIDDLAGLKVKVVTLTGGEPFLKSDIMDIVSRIKEKQMACNILTNGMLIKDTQARKLVELGVDTITFSLDGPLEVHDDIRQVKGAFEKVGQSITLLQEYKQRLGKRRPYLGINCTVSALNQNCFSQLVDTAAGYGLSAVNFGYLFFTDQTALKETAQMVDFGQSKEEDQVLPEYLRQVNLDELKKEIACCLDKAAQKGLNVSFSPPLDERELAPYFFDEKYAYSSRCFLPWFSSRINPYGDVYPCSIDVRVGNIRQTPFSALWNSPPYQNFRNRLKERKLFPKCSKCCNLNTKLWSYLPCG